VRARAYNVRKRPAAKALSVLVAIQVALLSIPAAADETKWRISKPDAGTAMLVMTDTDETTDAFESLYFHCKPGSGYVSVVQFNMEDKRLRTTIANLIVNNDYPTVQLDPAPERSVLEEITHSDDGGWGYRFQIGADAMAFNMFKTTGYINFKIGDAAVHAGIKAGLDKIAEFQAACRRQPGSRGAK
jgi:hypothetical protein